MSETRPTTVRVSVICGPEAWDPETGHVRLTSRWFRWFVRWVSEYEPTRLTVNVGIEKEPNIADSRSIAIREAKRHKPEFAVQVDTDVIVENTLEDTVRLLLDDRHRGYGIVTSPGRSAEGKLEVMWDVAGHNASGTSPWTVDHSWGGFLSFWRGVYLGMEPVGYYTSIANAKTDAYCMFVPYHPCPHCGKEIEGMGEDVSLIRQAQKAGGIECADPRIRTTHLKIAGIKSFREGDVVSKGEGPNEFLLEAKG